MDKIINLKNGLRVVLIEFPSENCVFSIYANGGLIYENFENLGISHFVEHLFTTNFSQKEINLAKYYDCSTSDDLVNLTFHFPVSKFDFFAKNILRTLKNPNFKTNNINLERQIILNEFQQDSYEQEDCLYNIYNNSIIGFSPLGKRKNIEKFSIDDLEVWHKKIFSPQNIVICIAANSQNLKKYSPNAVNKLSELKNKANRPNPVKISNIKKSVVIKKELPQKEIKIYTCFSLYEKDDILSNLSYEIIREKLFSFCEKQGIYDCCLEKYEYNNFFQVWYYDFLAKFSQSKKLFGLQLDFFQTLFKSINLLDLKKAKKDVLFDLETTSNSIFQKMDFTCINLLKGNEYDLKKLHKKYDKITLPEVILFIQNQISVSEFNFSLYGELDKEKMEQYKNVINHKRR